MDDTVAIATVALIAHVWAAVVWVGGMFFALIALRPATAPLEPAARLDLWSRVLARFFGWVFAAIVVLLASGYGLIFGVFGGFAGTGLHIHIMQGVGILMMLVFLHIYFAPWRRFQAAVSRRDVAQAARQLNQIRWIVAINLLLGLVTIAVGSSGRYWG
ncbi:MAG: CopD family protein [Alphaproteobacteria bacterium]